MISPIQLTPNMDAGTMTTAINNVFQQIEAENRSKMITDENGTNRIIIGLLPDGTYGIVVSKPGVDVNSLFKNTES